MFVVLFFFFFNDTATTEIYTLSLHDALPILALVMWAFGVDLSLVEVMTVFGVSQIAAGIPGTPGGIGFAEAGLDRKSTRLNSSHVRISYAVFCLKKKNPKQHQYHLQHMQYTV